MRIFILLVLLLGIGVSAIFLVLSPQTQSSEPNLLTKVERLVQMPNPTPTPVPFYEMTIPGLRERKYESSLGELTKVSDNGSYTSYTTSFLSDGFRVNGLLTIPKGQATRSPAIILVHGYIPPKSYQTLTRYTDHVNSLARSGFVVFKIDLRGHGDSEGEAGGGYYSEDYIVDTLNAYNALSKSDFVNPSAIGLWGHSMAGNVLLRSMVAKKDIPAIVIWAGAVYTYQDQQEYGIDDNSYQPPPEDSPRVRERQKLREIHGNFDEDSAFWKQVVPTNYLSDVSGAIQLNHAINDNVVSIEYSRNLNNILNQTNIEHELKEYSSGGHNITGAAFGQAMQNTIDFFKKHLR